MSDENIHETLDMLLYQEIIKCLELIRDNIKQPDGFNIPALCNTYEQCDDVIIHLLKNETNVNAKGALKELASICRWQKKRLEHMKRGTYSENNSKAGADESHPRRQMVLDTIVMQKSISLKDVAGLKDAKEVIKEAMIIPLKFPHLFSGVRKTWTRILLYGPPGTGKSRLAMAVASEIKATFFCVSSADLMSSWFGESEKMIKELFQCACQNGDCSLIFIDEIDSIGRRRTCNEDDNIRRVKTELLKQIDGIDDTRAAAGDAASCSSSNRVFLLCATNCPWELDPAVLRRFHKRIYISLPDRLSRMEILRLHTKETTSSFTDNDWETLLDKTQGFSGSDLSTLVMTALLLPIRDLQSTTCWSRSQDGKILPFSAGNEHMVTLQCKIDELPTDKVVPRDVTIDDFLNALTTSQRTVSGQDLCQFEEFTQQFGQFG